MSDQPDNRPLVKRSVIIAIIVGTLLNLINQSGALLGDEPIKWLPALLTYSVPFLVSFISGWLALSDRSKT